MDERARATATGDATVIRGGDLAERAKADGHFLLECRGADGKIKWHETIANVVCIGGKNLMLDTAFAGSSYSVTGPFLGLISAASYSGVSVNDTMASHAGWLEAGGTTAPAYTGNRKTAAFAAAASGAKTLAAPLSFSITGSGTLKGAFLCYGSGAVSTKDNAAGVLWSASTFVSGDKAVSTGDTVNVNYSTSL